MCNEQTIERRCVGISVQQDVATRDAQLDTPRRDGKAGDKIRVSLDVSPELFAKLQAMAQDIHGTKSDVLRKSLALLDVAIDARKRGKKIGIADSSDQLTTEIIGFEY